MGIIERYGNGNSSSSDSSDNTTTDEDNTGTSGSVTDTEIGNTTTDSTTEDSTTSNSTSSTGNGNATNAEENNSQNQCGILFPIAGEVSDTESYLISLIKTDGKEKNYELIEYVNGVNREYAEVLVEQNINGADDTTYVYGAVIGNGSDRLILDRFDGSTGYYLYDPRGSVIGITNEEGQIYQSYRYSVFGEITFGAPTYENEYTYNGESYNPNIESQYLRARYYDVVTATFITEDFYPQDMWVLWSITEPLTLNRYNYCVSSPLNYVDPSGHTALDILMQYVGDIDKSRSTDTWRPDERAGMAKRTSSAYQSLAPYLPVGGINAALWGDLTIPEEPVAPVEDNMQDEEGNSEIAYESIATGSVNDVGIQETRNDWLNLYSSRTVTSSLYIAREVELAESNHEIAWCNHEYPYGEKTAYINPHAYNQMVNDGKDVFSLEVSRNFLVNEQGRYWVAVGPKTLVEDYPDEGKVQADDFDYGTMMDVLVSDAETGELFYIPVVVGDVKNHTYPNGMYHTGTPYPNSGDTTIANADYSYIEFIRTNKDETSPFSKLNLRIEGIIVYEDAK